MPDFEYYIFRDGLMFAHLGVGQNKSQSESNELCLGLRMIMFDKYFGKTATI